jgi:hypothetical protein
LEDEISVTKSNQNERNPYTNKWIRKREKHVSKYDEVKATKQKYSKEDKTEFGKWKNAKSQQRNTKKTKKKNQYSNIKSANQWKLNVMFAEAYRKKNQKKTKRRR